MTVRFPLTLVPVGQTHSPRLLCFGPRSCQMYIPQMYCIPETIVHHWSTASATRGKNMQATVLSTASHTRHLESLLYAIICCVDTHQVQSIAATCEIASNAFHAARWMRDQRYGRLICCKSSKVRYSSRVLGSDIQVRVPPNARFIRFGPAQPLLTHDFRSEVCYRERLDR